MAHPVWKGVVEEYGTKNTHNRIYFSTHTYIFVSIAENSMGDPCERTKCHKRPEVLKKTKNRNEEEKYFLAFERKWPILRNILPYRPCYISMLNGSPRFRWKVERKPENLVHITYDGRTRKIMHTIKNFDCHTFEQWLDQLEFLAGVVSLLWRPLSEEGKLT